ncbi:Cthe_2314 family HEPN domain-containing protein, partial [Saccharibacillus sp. CPCC 101409]|uniref:Cthe_2314 family HEPN domain-containing protein n=1 Tax=Saccharibacillus sp. CPCC 101409 TaxID=3058041 RepID=UPI0026741233
FSSIKKKFISERAGDELRIPTKYSRIGHAPLAWRSPDTQHALSHEYRNVTRNYQERRIKMKYVRYPTEEEWHEILSHSPFIGFQFSSDDFVNNAPDVTIFFNGPIINSYGSLLVHRFRALLESYIMLSFYYQLGIPDNVEDKNTSGIFKKFEPDHFGNKEKFDYYSDVFYLKAFACLEAIGHILKERYNLTVKRVEFKNIVGKMKNENPDLFKKLGAIIENNEFFKANTYRNQITHNHSPNLPGIHRLKDINGAIIEVETEYYNSKMVYRNILSVSELLKEAIEAIRE